MSELTVLSWLWRQDGGRAEYGPEAVNTWAAMVRRNLSMPHRIACVTDHPEGIDSDIAIIEPPRDFEDVRLPTWDDRKPQCLRRLAMFGPDATRIFGERFICMDLDCVVAGPLDPLFDVPDDFRIMRGTSPDRPYNGSMILLTAGARPQVYSEFTPERAVIAGRHFLGSDQAWIAFCLGWEEATWGDADGVLWFSPRYSDRVPPEARVMFFPGSQKPWTVNGFRPLDRWVQQHYGRDRELAA